MKMNRNFLTVIFLLATFILQAVNLQPAFAAEPFVIDDFSQSLGAVPDELFNHEIICITAWPSEDPESPYCQDSLFDYEENTIPVGYRKVSLSAEQPLTNDEQTVERTPIGEVSFSTFGTDAGRLDLQYGSPAQPLGLNLGSKGSQFEIEILSYDVETAAPFTVYVTDGSGNSASASASYTTPGFYTIPFSSFAGTNFADVDVIVLSFTDANISGLDLTFDNFRVTGEPLPQPGLVFSGFFSPIDLGMINTAKAGQTIPVKWRLTDGSGAPVSDPGSFTRMVTYSVNCSGFSGTPTDVVEEYTSNSSGLQYTGDGYWQFNWKTPKTYANTCRAMYVEFTGGLVSPVVHFQFKK